MEPGGSNPANPELTRFSLICHAANVSHWLHLRANVFLINFLLGPTAVGLYTVSQALCESLWILPRVTASALMPAVAAQEKDPGLSQTLRACRTTVFLTAIAGLGLCLVASPLIQLVFGPEFAGSVVPLWFLLPGVCLGACTGILSSFLTGRGRPELPFYNSFTSLVLNLVLNLVLIPRYGISGAAMASTVSYSFSALLNYFFLRQMTNVAVRNVVLIHREEIWRIIRAPLATR